MSVVDFQSPRDFNFKANTREYFIAQQLLMGKSREDIARHLFHMVGIAHPFIYKLNPGGGRPRTPKPREAQYKIFLQSINNTINAMERQGWQMQEPILEEMRWTEKSKTYIRWRSNFISKLIAEGLNDHPAEPTPPEYVFEVNSPAELPPVPVPLPPTLGEEIELFYTRLMRARAFVTQRELGGEYLDFVSTRAVKDGVRGIFNGLTSDEMMAALTKTWPDDAKNELVNWYTEWTPKTNTDIDISRYPTVLEGGHVLLGYIHKLAKGRIPILLVGPAGCGKSYAARDLAELMDLAYGELPLTAGATPSWLVGAETITGYKSRPFVDIYAAGGVFCLEEIDAADPNMLLLVNNALAQESFWNPVTGQEVKKHKNFVVTATANTWGLGANRVYRGREGLDAATLDRFRMGRVEFDYDRNIERTIVNYYKEQANKKVKKAVVKPSA